MEHETDLSPPRTGIEGLDEVIDSVAALGQAPVEEHVVVLEHAHDGLRRALERHE